MSSIEWTDATWNPVTGCSRVSPGCDNCYMFAMYPRLRAMNVNGYETSPDDVQMMRGRLNAPLSWVKPRLVFVNSMSDLFHPKVDFGFIAEIFRVMREASERRGHLFQVLTKRPGRAVAWWKRYAGEFSDSWPERVWIGVSVETQKYAPRLTVLSRLPAKVRFVSAEPLLGELDLSEWLEAGELHWVIAGGESGAGARPMKLEWARRLRDQCLASGVPFFLKQLGGRWNRRRGDAAVLDGRRWKETPTRQSASYIYSYDTSKRSNHILF